MTFQLSPDEGCLLLRLIAAHIVSDFILQRDDWVADRSRNGWASPWLYAHGALSAAMIYLSAFRLTAFWLPAIVFFSHVLFDGLKSKKNDSVVAFVFDQAGHFLILAGCWTALIGLSYLNWLSWIRGITGNQSFWTITVAYLLVVWPAGVWIRKTTAPWWKNLKPPKDRGLDRAGLWIGRLERVLILTFILLSRYEAIGFLMTAKSILRFGELRKAEDRREAEYVLIGTMLSMGFALAVGLGVKFFL
jgi:hypothetical protein